MHYVSDCGFSYFGSKLKINENGAYLERLDLGVCYKSWSGIV